MLSGLETATDIKVNTWSQ